MAANVIGGYVIYLSLSCCSVSHEKLIRILSGAFPLSDTKVSLKSVQFVLCLL